MNGDTPNSEIGNGDVVPRILGALAQLMRDYHDRDLALQNAVAGLTQMKESPVGINITDLQHLDLVTQTHGELAKFLPKLAQRLRDDNDVEDVCLAGTLTLRSLQDLLLGPAGLIDAPPEKVDEVDPGECLLF